MNLKQRKKRQELAKSLRGKSLQDLTPQQRERIKKQWQE